jgi:hypothetical protein
MKFLIVRIAAVCCLAVLLSANVVGQRSLRVLVDASKCGGLWWFPQGPTFDQAKHHQGKAFADFMRRKGWQVTELPRGEVITFDKLRDADIVIRPPAYFGYSAEEVMAYHQSVTAGTRLLLIGGGANPDAVAQFFGLRFEPETRFAPVRRWIPHPFTQNIDSFSTAWTAISEAPAGAVVLAWLSREEDNPRPALGYLPYGNGYVVFMSQSLIEPGPSSAFNSNLVNALVRYRSEEIRQIPVGPPVVANESTGMPPVLLEPVAGATLPQPESADWRFDWDDVPGAKSYELVVLGPSAMFPLFHVTTTKSEFIAPARQGYIVDANLEGWSWRVRTHYGGTTCGPWTASRRFNVMRRTR